jgi:hypothetical protein
MRTRRARAVHSRGGLARVCGKPRSESVIARDVRWLLPVPAPAGTLGLP